MPFTQRVKTYIHLHRQPFKLHFIIGIKRREKKYKTEEQKSAGHYCSDPRHGGVCFGHQTFMILILLILLTAARLVRRSKPFWDYQHLPFVSGERESAEAVVTRQYVTGSMSLGNYCYYHKVCASCLQNTGYITEPADICVYV